MKRFICLIILITVLASCNSTYASIDDCLANIECDQIFDLSNDDSVYVTQLESSTKISLNEFDLQIDFDEDKLLVEFSSRRNFDFDAEQYKMYDSLCMEIELITIEYFNNNNLDVKMYIEFNDAEVKLGKIEYETKSSVQEMLTEKVEVITDTLNGDYIDKPSFVFKFYERTLNSNGNSIDRNIGYVSLDMLFGSLDVLAYQKDDLGIDDESFIDFLEDIFPDYVMNYS